jgi:Fe-S cluster assembly iron-binding protein IscA
MHRFDIYRPSRHGGETAGVTCDERELPNFDERNPTVITLTDNAASQIRNLVAQPDIPDEGGVRIASSTDGALTLSVAPAPFDGDAVVDEDGARVFLEPEADQLLDGRRLDAGVDNEGSVRFSIE